MSNLNLDTILNLFLERNPKWSRERVQQAALGLFLMQNAYFPDEPALSVQCAKFAARSYLDALFPTTSEESLVGTTSYLVEIPEELHQELNQYLELNPDETQESFFSQAIASLLTQKGG